MKRDALISSCEAYRYWLSRSWGGTGKRALFLMLNPSTADAQVDDRTIQRCVSLAESWGCSSLHVVNLFAFRATHPKDMFKAKYPVGPDNAKHIKDLLGRMTPRRDLVVCAWGNHGRYLDQDKAVLALIEKSGHKARCLEINKNGTPKHPLYVRRETRLIPYSALLSRVR